FIRDEGEFSVFADRELLGVRPDMPPVFQFPRGWIDDAETIGAFVCWCAIFIQTRRHSRRATQCNKESTSVGSRVNAARPVSHWKCSNDAVCGTINDRHIARAFVADEHEIALGFSARCGGQKDPSDERDKPAMHG